MKALVLDRPGKPDVLYLTEVDKPTPGRGEVRVRVQAVGLNPVDYKLAATGYPGWKFPFILGLDIAGVIDAVGPDVDDWSEGDPVYYLGDMKRPGGYGQYTIASTDALAWMPENMNPVEAAALPCAGFTAYQALYRKLRVQKDRTILIHSGSGGVGSYAIQLAKAAGLTVIASCSAHNFEFVKRLGAEHTIDYKNSDVAAVAKSFTEGERGVDYVLDSVSSESARRCMEALAFGGEIACVAGMPDLSDVPQFTKAFSVHEIALGAAYASGDEVAIADLGRMGRELAALVAKAKIRPTVQEVIALEEIPEALVRLSNRHVRGKIVARVP